MIPSCGPGGRMRRPGSEICVPSPGIHMSTPGLARMISSYSQAVLPGEIEQRVLVVGGDGGVGADDGRAVGRQLEDGGAGGLAPRARDSPSAAGTMLAAQLP